MTLTELKAAREQAGEKYQDAVDQLYECYIELAALDASLGNSNINPGFADIKTFSPLAADLRPFDHPRYCPLKLPSDWRATIAERRDELIEHFRQPQTYHDFPERSFLE